MAKILFLDIDGVMNYTEGEKAFVGECEYSYRKPWKEIPAQEHYRIDEPYPRPVEVLNSIIERTNCNIVISSSWKEEFSTMGWNRYFCRCGIKPVVIGKTPVIQKYSGTEIVSWILDYTDLHWNEDTPNKIESFAVLDDDYDPVFRFVGERWVLTDTNHGLDIEQGDAVVNLLNNVPFNADNFEVKRFDFRHEIA